MRRPNGNGSKGSIGVRPKLTVTQTVNQRPFRKRKADDPKMAVRSSANCVKKDRLRSALASNDR